VKGRGIAAVKKKKVYFTKRDEQSYREPVAKNPERKLRKREKVRPTLKTKTKRVYPIFDAKRYGPSLV